MNDFDVRIYAIRRRKDRRRPFEARWYAAGRPWSRSFITRALADGFRAELVRATRKGTDLAEDSGEPVNWTQDPTAVVSWLQHASTYAAMKWPAAAAHSRAGIADALATITPALTSDGARRPPAGLLRAAFYGWAFNPGRADSQPPGIIADALVWAQHHSLPLASLADPARHTARAGRPDAANGRHQGSSHDYWAQARSSQEGAQLRRRDRPAARQPTRPAQLAATPGQRCNRSSGHGQPAAGRGDPGRDSSPPSRTDRVLRMLVLRGVAPGGSSGADRCRLPCAAKRLGRADSLRSGTADSGHVDRERDLARAARSQAPA